MPISVRKIIVHALVYSVLRYGLTVYGHCTLRWSSRINSILRSLLSTVAYDLCPKQDADVFRLLNLPNFTSLIIESVVIKHFWNNDFKTRYTPVRSLRPKEPYVIPKTATKYGRRTRQYYVPAIFNKLPTPVLEANTRREIKKQLRIVDV